MTTVAVYAGWQQPPDHPDCELAAEVGRELAGQGFDIVFGGGDLGAMGAAALAAHEAGATVTAVTRPVWEKPVDREWRGGLVLRDALSERMAELEARADAFLILPGGRGTVTELWSALSALANGDHDKRVLVLDPAGLFDLQWEQDQRLVSGGYGKPFDPGVAPVACATPAEAVRLLCIPAGMSVR